MKNYSRIIADKIVMYEGSNLEMNNKASIIINDEGEFTIRDYAVFDLFNESKIQINGDLIIGNNVGFNFYNHSKLDVEGNLLIGEFVKFNFYEGLLIVKNSYVHLGKGSSFYIENGGISLSGRKLFISGTNYSPVIFKSESQFEKKHVLFVFDSIYVNYAEFIYVEAIIHENEGILNGDISIYNSVFRNSNNALSLFGKPNNASYTINLQYNTFKNITFNSIYLTSIINAVIKNNNIINLQDYRTTSRGIVLSDCGNIEISDCFFDINNKSAIEIGTNYKEDIVEPSSYGNYTLSNLTIKGNSVSDYGIIVDGYKDNIQLVNIYDSRIEAFKNAITIQNFDNFLPQIIYNEIVDFSDIGISLTAGNNALIRHNNLSTNGEANFGIFASQVSNIIVLDNEIIGDNLYNPESGLFISSTNGDIRRNKITGFKFGIESGGSRLNLAQNEITENYEYGLNIKDGSILDLGFSDIDEEGFLISGYNKIYGNGLCYEWVNSEIFVDNALIFLNNGCNTVADDRDDPNCDYRLLIDGVNVQDQIKAVENYWGDHPYYSNDPSERFGGEITVIYDDFLSEPCELTDSEEFILHIASGGIVVDTLYSTGRVTENLNQLQVLYSDANKEFYTGNYSASIQKYNQIINNYGTTPGSISAYMKLYRAEKLSGAFPGQFSNLKNLYVSKLPAISDSLMLGIIEHLINLCIVAEEEYITAIGNFETLALDNPGTDLAFYSELNALTTYLRLSSDSTLGKVSANYALTGINDYHDRVNKLLKKRKGLYSENEVELIPTEYYLHQNYPNPFNPVTIIRYEIPERSKVELRVYDILGKEIVTLVNEFKEAGRYEASFNADRLSSGVYIYTIRAGEFISSKKMMLVK